MKTDIFDVKIGDIALVVHGTYSPADYGDRETPPTSANVEIEQIFYKDVDVTALINEIHPSYFETIEDKIIEKQ